MRLRNFFTKAARPVTILLIIAILFGNIPFVYAALDKINQAGTYDDQGDPQLSLF